MIQSKVLLFLATTSLFIHSCAQEAQTSNQCSETIEKEGKTEDENPNDEPHQYSGWYCPDNFGFKPVDISDLSSVPVVRDRMPSKEETQNGTSLMYLPECDFCTTCAH